MKTDFFDSLTYKLAVIL